MMMVVVVDLSREQVIEKEARDARRVGNSRCDFNVAKQGCDGPRNSCGLALLPLIFCSQLVGGGCCPTRFWVRWSAKQFLRGAACGSDQYGANLYVAHTDEPTCRIIVLKWMIVIYHRKSPSSPSCCCPVVLSSFMTWSQLYHHNWTSP